MMDIPEMIVFDFGNTLAKQVGDCDILKGNEAVIGLTKRNKNNITPKQLSELAAQINEDVYSIISKANIEVNGLAFSRLLYSVAGLSFDIEVEEVYAKFCETALQYQPMDGAADLLQYLKQNNIKFGVLSNTVWSKKVLSSYLSKLFPSAKFEFVMTSSDYLLCKPESYLFQAMVNIADISKQKLWFCGDLIHRDIEGANKVGIKTILIDHFGNYAATGKYAQYKVPSYTTTITNLSEIIGLIKEVQ